MKNLSPIVRDEDLVTKEYVDGKISTKIESSDINGNIKVNGEELEVYKLPPLTSADVGLGNVPNVTTNDQKPTFSEATTRANINSGETLSTILGKIKKFFTDLKTVAFTGKYDDLTNKPNFLTGGSQTTTSIVDGGNNVYTFTTSDGEISTFIVKNGSKGTDGINGKDGLTTKVVLGGTTFTHNNGTITVTDAAVQKAVTPTAPISGHLAIYDGTTGKLKDSGLPIATQVATHQGVNWNSVPYIKSDGVMEIGSHIDFHSITNEEKDYGFRLQYNGTNLLAIGGSIQGNLVGNATSASTATKLTTARTINNVAFDGTKNILINPVQNYATNATAINNVDVATGFYNIENVDIGTEGKYHRLIALGEHQQAPTGFATEIDFPYDGGNIHNLYVRWSNTTTWGVWKKIAFYDDITAYAPSKTGSGASGNWNINAATATKLGTNTVGSGIKPIYLNAGSPAASTNTVGNATTPVYLNGGTITACSNNFGQYLPLAGGTMTGPIATTMNTGTYINGSKGVNVVINHNAAANVYKTLFKTLSTNGAFTMSSFNNTLLLGYESNTKITANTNSLDKQVILLNEAGDSFFPGNVSAAKFNGYPIATEVATHQGVGWGCIPILKSDGVMEIGRYLDFHAVSNETKDFGFRCYWNGTNLITSGGSVQGTFIPQYALVGTSGTVSGSWYKFASFVHNIITDDLTVTFRVRQNFAGGSRYGILTAHVRSSAPKGTFANAELVWHYCSNNINLNNFVLAYKATPNDRIDVELWCNIPDAWHRYFFEVVGVETLGIPYRYSLVTLYSNNGGNGATAITSGFTQIKSTVLTLGNNISGNAANVTGIVPVANGGTGANNATAARANLKVHPYAVVGNGGGAELSPPYCKIFSVPISAWNSYSIRLLIAPNNCVNYYFRSFECTLSLGAHDSGLYNPAVIVDLPIASSTQYNDVLSRLIVAQNSSSPSGNIELWINAKEAWCSMRITVLDVAWRGATNNSDCFEQITFNATPMTGVASISLPNQFVFKNILQSSIQEVINAMNASITNGSARDNTKLPLAGGTLTGNLNTRAILPTANNTYAIGSSTMKYSNVYATTFTGSLSGNATSATNSTNSNNLLQNTRMDYGWSGINYFNAQLPQGNAAKVNDAPTATWWHILRFNHSNNAGYYTDLAVPLLGTNLYFKRIANGAVQNNGWIQILDSLNYNNFAPTKTGTGASGNWNINITGNAAKLGTANVGSGVKPIYLNAGSPAASTNTVGNATTPVYLNGGTITACSNNFGQYLPLAGGTVTGTLYLSRTMDASGTADNRPALIIGNVAGEHIEADINEIMAKSNATTPSTLFFNSDGGDVGFGGNACPKTPRGQDLGLTNSFWRAAYIGAGRFDNITLGQYLTAKGYGYLDWYYHNGTSSAHSASIYATDGGFNIGLVKDKAGNIGDATHRFANIYSETFYGNLNGINNGTIYINANGGAVGIGKNTAANAAALSVSDAQVLTRSPFVANAGASGIITVVSGSGTKTTALPAYRTKALIMVWQQVGVSSTASATMTGSVYVTGLSSNMTAKGGTPIVAGVSGTISYSISTAGAITVTTSTGTSAWTIIYFN